LWLYGRRGNYLPAIVLLTLGAVAGSLVGETLGDAVPLLGHSAVFGFDVRQVAIADIIGFHIGLTFDVNLLTVVGAVLGFWLGRR